MPLSINTNIASLTAQRAMYQSNSSLETAFERLSTGKRVNSAVDDAAGLAIGKDLESRVSGLNQAIRNVNDGISMVQIAEGSLDEVTTILQRMRDLSVQAANGSLSTVEQGYLDAEQLKLASTLDSVINQSQFNGTDLVSSTASTTISIQSGADAADTMNIVTSAMTAETLGVNKEVISLNGTASSAETVTFDAFLAQGMTKSTQTIAAFNTKMASGGAGTYTVTLNNATDGNITFTTSTINAPADMDELVAALNAISGLSDHGTFANDSNALDFNAKAGGLHGQFTITSAGFTTDVNDAGSPATEGAQTAANSGLGTDGTTAANDVYTLTVGTNTYTTAAASATSDYNTNKEIATALQAKLTAEGVTDFTIGTAGGYSNTAITLTYAANGNQTQTTYNLEKTTGTASSAVADSSPTIVDGTSQASDAITAIDAALATVASERATLGATQSQLESTVRNLANVAENTAAAQGRIMDTDYAAETANLTKAQILQQAATSILAQANAQPQAVLSLLQ